MIEKRRRGRGSFGRRFLIVNADDCNLTEGVTGAILDAHGRGIVSSTTFLVNLPVRGGTIRRLKARKNLGVGLHLNVTLGPCVSPRKEVSSLVDENGRFLKNNRLLTEVRLRAAHVEREYEAQVRLFKKLFGRFPTHLDTHHQLHDEPFFLEIFLKTARRFRLPVRRTFYDRGSKPMLGRVRSTTYLFGSLEPSGYWRKKNLLAVLKNLPEGLSEVMCHPGRVDAALRNISSFTAGRQKEWRLLSSPSLKEKLSGLGIQLTHFGVWYTKR